MPHSVITTIVYANVQPPLKVAQGNKLTNSFHYQPPPPVYLTIK